MATLHLDEEVPIDDGAAGVVSPFGLARLRGPAAVEGSQRDAKVVAKVMCAHDELVELSGEDSVFCHLGAAGNLCEGTGVLVVLHPNFIVTTAATVVFCAAVAQNVIWEIFAHVLEEGGPLLLVVVEIESIPILCAKI